MEQYIPKEHDVVLIDGRGSRGYVVTKVDARKKTADVKSVSAITLITYDVPWAELHPLKKPERAE